MSRCRQFISGICFFYEYEKLFGGEGRLYIKRHSTIFMKGNLRLLLAIIASYPFSLMAEGVDCVLPANIMDQPYHANARFEVWLPSSEEPVVYDVELYSTPAPGDTLSPCNYFIKWTLSTAEDQSAGFSAYYAGHHYRYRGDRLQEYHVEWDPMPFSPSLSGSRGQGVQRTAQFADLLPAFLMDKLDGMTTDSTFKYSVNTDAFVDGKKSVVIKGEQSSAEFTGQEFTYVFSAADGLPVSVDLNSNPGTISEQIVSVKYTTIPGDDIVIDENMLIERYPDVFEKYRENNFRIENLRGKMMPEFAAKPLNSIDDKRFIHNKDEAFRVPTLIALLDPAIGDVKGLTENIREAIGSLPFDSDIIWAFVSNKADEIEDLLGSEPRAGEYTLLGARKLARDTGAASLPVVIIVNRSGKVEDIIVGDNKNMSSIVIQKMAVMPQE